MRRLIWAVMIGILLMPATARAQDEVVYYHTDAIGSVRMITDEAGTIIARYDYTPFGQPWNPPSTAELLQFTGKERDLQTELDYFVARDFMSLTGRFTTPDDPSYMDPFNPQSMNRFAYAYNNPFRYIDPSGHEPCPHLPSATYTCVEGKAGTGELALDFSRWMLAQFIRQLTATTPGVMGSTPFGPPVLKGVGLLAGSVAQQAGAGAITGRLTQQGLEHIVIRHWATSGAQRAGKFLSGTTARSLKGLINQALEQGTVRANTLGRAGHMVEYDFGRQIGVNISGQASTRLRVVLWPDGTVRTAFPY
jgi:RHS repeat-associated protein